MSEAAEKPSRIMPISPVMRASYEEMFARDNNSVAIVTPDLATKDGSNTSAAKWFAAASIVIGLSAAYLYFFRRRH